MSWNYRIMRSEEDVPGTGVEPFYRIIEVHYVEGKPTAWAEASPPNGATVDEVSSDLARMIAALSRPVLDDKMVEVEPAKLLADDLQAAIDADPTRFPVLLQKAEGTA